MASCKVLLAAALVAAPVSAWAGDLTVSQAWIRDVSPQLPAAGYFMLSNAGSKAAVLTGASSPSCAQLMLHRSEEQAGQMRMQMVPSITVPPHGKVTFSPGGYHLMCMAPTLTVGGKAPVTLQFANGTVLSADFVIRNAKGK
jgi:copper(I)-binding protein